MDIDEFKERGEQVIDYIVDYFESVSQRPVTPGVTPGYLQVLLPSTAPVKGESFDKIMEDFEKFILPGMTHWQHPRFHAFFPSITSYPSILAEMLISSIGGARYSYSISPAVKELEAIVLDWYGEMTGLPNHLMHYAKGSEGGGIVEDSCSECVLLCLITARDETLNRLKEQNPHLCKEALLSSLIAYCSIESHSSVEKAGAIALVNMKILEVDKDYRLRGETIAKAVKEDKKRGLVPFFASINLGTTSCCSCDPIDEIGPVCEANEIWLHVDAAYGGTALVCPEYRHLLKGIEYASSININAAKWMLVNLHCSVLWTKDRSKVNDTIVYETTQLDYSAEGRGYPCNKHFHVLKLWFVIRNYGVEGLQKLVRNHVRLAKMFASYVQRDSRFEILTNQFGLVCFRLKGSNGPNRKLLMAVNATCKLLLTGCSIERKYSIRFCVSSRYTTDDDVKFAWSTISNFANDVLLTERQRFSLCEIDTSKAFIHQKMKWK